MGRVVFGRRKGWKRRRRGGNIEHYHFVVKEALQKGVIEIGGRRTLFRRCSSSSSIGIVSILLGLPSRLQRRVLLLDLFVGWMVHRNEWSNNERRSNRLTNPVYQSVNQTVSQRGLEEVIDCSNE
jgi:hypothetical protein